MVVGAGHMAGGTVRGTDEGEAETVTPMFSVLVTSSSLRCLV